ncbi:Gfo/Idh/MocA family oxidoreductase [Streptomyces sp. NBC_01275]|uniref:Gfo/Idh/MocA family protein n=1 Tax=Streptomyces sp. NBC_01275 TaxID=2903807 RepID=UPI0022566084|nr:Gfo/Idh/MocA family oxidoreductase [Streptomyces sp. NBC_01275]MCX4760215.1 Gfo/Idh/MocA family oxidoreductase [Streptomyces sp. NBC_01275]
MSALRAGRVMTTAPGTDTGVGTGVGTGTGVGIATDAGSPSATDADTRSGTGIGTRSGPGPGPEAACAPLRIGVLGAASIARRRMLPAFAAAPETRITAIATREPGRCDDLADAHGCAAVTGYGAMLARPDVDAVYIPTPASLHARWAHEALLAGKHVLVEKPLTSDPAEATRLTALAASRSLVLMENVMFVHHGAHSRVAELVRSGTIGRLRHFQAVFTIPALPDDDIRHRPDLGGGALVDVGVYPLRAAGHFLGTGLQVAGATLVDEPRYGVDTAGAVLLRTPGPDPVTAHLVFGMRHAYESSYELWGSHGRIRVERAFTPPADQAPIVRVRTDREQTHGLPAEDQVRATVRAFASAALGRPGAAEAARLGAQWAVELARLLAAVRVTASGAA